MKTLILLMTLLISLNSHSSESVVFAYSEIPPFSTEYSEEKGMLNEILRESFRAVNINVDLKKFPFSRILKGLKNQTISGASVLWYTDERAKYITYSEPVVMSAKALFFTRDFNFKSKSLKDVLKGKKISFTRGYAKPKILLELQTKITEVDNDVQAFRLLRAGRVDFVFVGKRSGLFTLRNSKIGLKTIKSKVVEKQWIYFGLSKADKNSEELKRNLNRGLNIIKSSGKFKEIIDRY